MNKDQKLLEEAYRSIYESSLDPLYFGSSDQKALWLKWLGLIKHTVNGDGSIDVHQDVNFNRHYYDKTTPFNSLFPLSVLPFKFNVVEGDFIANSNNLPSLVNFPRRVEGTFHIPNVGPLKTLEGCPEYVGGDFNFYSTSESPMKNFIGGPKFIGGDITVQSLNIESLEGLPKTIPGSINASYNNNLNTLRGAPEIVRGNFSVYYANLTSLEGSPRIVDGDFDCAINSIKTLEGCPKTVGQNFHCAYNKLISLEGCPKVIKGYFNCSNNLDLNSLVGGPEIVEGNFDCRETNIVNLKGAPEVIKGTFECNQISDADYRIYTKKKEIINKNLSKDFGDIDAAISDFS